MPFARQARTMMPVSRSALSCLAALALLAACQKPPSALYVFEAQPRPIALPDGRQLRFPRLAVDTSTGSGGVVFLLATAEETGGRPALTLLTSTDGGDRFDSVAAVSKPAAAVGSHGEDAPSLLLSDQAPQAIWEQSKDEHNDVLFAQSPDFGGHFDKPVRVTDTDPARSVYSGYASGATGSNADVYAAWLDWRDPAPTGEDSASIYASHSSDGGKTFAGNIRVAAGVCPCCRPNITVGPGGEVIVIWRKIYPGGLHDFAASVSADHGRSFGEPVRVAEDNWKIDGCPDSGAAVAWLGRRLFVAWLTEGAGKHGGVRMTWSDEAGRSFAPAVSASQDVLDANYPSMSATPDGRILLAFQGRDRGRTDGWGKMRPFLVEISAAGTLSPPVQVPVPAEAPGSSRPSIASGSLGRVFIAWTEQQQGAHQVMFTRARRAE